MIRRILKWLKLYERSDIEMNGSVYMRRWRFLPDWMPGFRIHEIMRSDEDRELHNHPFGFISIILRGGYREFTENGGSRWYGPGSVVVRPANTFHRIELKTYNVLVDREHGASTYKRAERPALTLVFRTRYFQQWGFKMDDGSFVHWKDFTEKRRRPDAVLGKFAAPSSI